MNFLLDLMRSPNSTLDNDDDDRERTAEQSYDVTHDVTQDVSTHASLVDDCSVNCSCFH